jgi:hypothetical protein
VRSDKACAGKEAQLENRPAQVVARVLLKREGPRWESSARPRGSFGGLPGADLRSSIREKGMQRRRELRRNLERQHVPHTRHDRQSRFANSFVLSASYRRRRSDVLFTGDDQRRRGDALDLITELFVSRCEDCIAAQVTHCVVGKHRLAHLFDHVGPFHGERCCEPALERGRDRGSNTTDRSPQRARANGELLLERAVMHAADECEPSNDRRTIDREPLRDERTHRESGDIGRGDLQVLQKPRRLLCVVGDRCLRGWRGTSPVPQHVERHDPMPTRKVLDDRIHISAFKPTPCSSSNGKPLPVS